jgi:hypothetical protein
MVADATVIQIGIDLVAGERDSIRIEWLKSDLSHLLEDGQGVRSGVWLTGHKTNYESRQQLREVTRTLPRLCRA